MEGAASALEIRGRGETEFPVRGQDDTVRVMRLSNVLYVPSIKFNLLSVRKAQLNDGLKVSFGTLNCVLSHEGGKYKVGVPVRGNLDLYVLHGLGKQEVALIASGHDGTKIVMLWHRRFGHPGETVMRALHRAHFEKGTASFSKSQLKDFFCESCVLAKATRLPFSKVAARLATRPGEILYTDKGTLLVATVSGYRYFLVLVDEYSRYVFTFLLKK
jgi:hypothetical protein